MSINDIWTKIKGFTPYRTYALVVLSFLMIGWGSFGLGRLYEKDKQKEPITIENAPMIENDHLSVTSTSTLTIDTPLKRGGQYVAAKTGTVYYYRWCGAVKRIKPENMVYFDSKEDAEKTGLKPASNCAGLK